VRVLSVTDNSVLITWDTHGAVYNQLDKENTKKVQDEAPAETTTAK